MPEEQRTDIRIKLPRSWHRHVWEEPYRGTFTICSSCNRVIEVGHRDDLGRCCYCEEDDLDPTPPPQTPPRLQDRLNNQNRGR